MKKIAFILAALALMLGFGITTAVPASAQGLTWSAYYTSLTQCRAAQAAYERGGARIWTPCHRIATNSNKFQFSYTI